MRFQLEGADLSLTLACSTRQRPATSRASRSRPNADQAMTSKPPAYDYPPAYDNAVRVHQPQTASQEKTEAVPLSMLERMKTRGGELVAKVYYYRTPNGGRNNSNSAA